MTKARSKPHRYQQPPSTVGEALEIIERAEHRRALLWSMLAHLDRFRRQNGEAPERSLRIQRNAVDARVDVVEELVHELHELLAGARRDVQWARELDIA